MLEYERPPPKMPDLPDMYKNLLGETFWEGSYEVAHVPPENVEKMLALLFFHGVTLMKQRGMEAFGVEYGNSKTIGVVLRVRPSSEPPADSYVYLCDLVDFTRDMI